MSNNDNMKIKYTLFRPISIILFYSTLSMFIVLANKEKYFDIELFKDISILNILCVLFGFSLAAITLLYASYEKLFNIIMKKEIEESHRLAIKENLLNILKELRDDIKLIFIILVVLVVVISLRDIDIPIISWGCELITKKQLIESIKLSGLFLSLRAVWDLLQAILKILDISVVEVK